jgi:hypothetical protein
MEGCVRCVGISWGRMDVERKGLLVMSSASESAVSYGTVTRRHLMPADPPADLSLLHRGHRMHGRVTGGDHQGSYGICVKDDQPRGRTREICETVIDQKWCNRVDRNRRIRVRLVVLDDVED